MYRLWTLQEGILARNLQVKFEDGLYALNAEEVVKWIRKLGSASLQNFAVQLGSTFIDVRLEDEDCDNVDHELYRITRMLRGHSVSVKSDEPICLGALLRLNVKAIVEEVPDVSILSQWQRDVDLRDRRMYKLWSLLPGAQHTIPIPRDMIFSYGGTRLTKKGFRWAPNTLLGVEGRAGRLFLKKGASRAKISPEGLRLTSLSFAVSGMDGVNSLLASKLLDQIWPYDAWPYDLILDKGGQWYKIGANHEIDQVNDLVLPKTLAEDQHASYEILTKYPLQDLHEVHAVLVRPMRVDSEVKLVEAIKQVTITKFDLQTSELLTDIYLRAIDLHDYEAAREIDQAVQQGDNLNSRYWPAADRLKKKVWEILDECIRNTGIDVPPTSLGLHLSPRMELFGLLVRFYRNRVVFMSDLSTEEQAYCVD